MILDSLDKFEKSIVQSINSLKDEIINLKEIVIKNLQDENTRLKVKCAKLENRVAILESNHNDRKNCEKVLSNKKVFEVEQ